MKYILLTLLCISSSIFAKGNVQMVIMIRDADDGSLYLEIDNHRYQIKDMDHCSWCYECKWEKELELGIRPD